MATVKKAPKPPAKPRMGRPLKPNAKSNDPDFEKKTILARKQTVLDVNYRLKSRADKRTFSDVVDELLTGWLKANPK